MWVRSPLLDFVFFSAQHTKKYIAFVIILLASLFVKKTSYFLFFRRERAGEEARDGSRLLRIDNTSWKSSWCMSVAGLASHITVEGISTEI